MRVSAVNHAFTELKAVLHEQLKAAQDKNRTVQKAAITAYIDARANKPFKTMCEMSSGYLGFKPAVCRALKKIELAHQSVPVFVLGEKYWVPKPLLRKFTRLGKQMSDAKLYLLAGKDKEGLAILKTLKILIKEIN